MEIGREVHLLRFVPGRSPVHRLWAGTKLLCVAALSIAVVAKPTWPAEAVGWLALVGALAVARVPRSALPHAPRWFVIGIAIGFGFAVTSGGDPTIHALGHAFGLGGLIDWARFTTLGLLVLVMAMLLGWTTPLAEFPGALNRLYAPLRLVRLPVDELVMAVALAARCVPLLIDEMRVLGAARRLRQPEVPTTMGDRLRALHDLLVTALVSALRRARDLADALDSRGGPERGPRVAVQFGARDVLALVLAALAVVVIVVV